MTNFFLIANMSGIACASNSDHTIYQLSKNEPLAVAVNPDSQLPWDDIIEGYRRKGEPLYHKDFLDYVRDFAKYMKDMKFTKEWNMLSDDDRKIIFMGYGTDSLYPCIYDTSIDIKDGKELYVNDGEMVGISAEYETTWRSFGDFNDLSPLFNGITVDMRNRLIDKQKDVYKTYKQRVVEKFAGTKYEKRVEDAFNKYDVDAALNEEYDNAVLSVNRSVSTGLESFSMEELVYACENIVNVSSRLRNLRLEHKAPLTKVNEIAVITRSEGLTWIKHSLFAI